MKYQNFKQIKRAIQAGQITSPYCLHIPKTGGTYAKNVLYSSGWYPNLERSNALWEHTYFSKKIAPVEGFQPDPITPEELTSHLVFAIVRNPFDLLVSHYTYTDEDNQYGWSRVRQRHNLNSFGEFIEYFCHPAAEYFCPPMKRFMFFPMYDDNGDCQVDLIIYNDMLDEGLQLLYALFGAEVPKLGQRHRRVNSSRQRDYTEYYDPYLRKLVEQACELELSMFDYHFYGRHGLHPIEVPSGNRRHVHPEIITGGKE